MLLHRCVEVDLRANRHHTCWVDGFVRAIVMLLNVLHIYSALYFKDLINLASEAPEVRIVNQSLLICLEVPYTSY